VPVPLCQVLPMLLLVFPVATLAQAGSLEPELPSRQLELSLHPRPELWVAPGQPLLVRFDALLAVATMSQVGAVRGLRRVEVAERAVTLVPSAGLKVDTLVEYTLHFADGRPAGGVTLLLRVNSARAEPEVEVYRDPIPAAELKRQVAALTARLEAQRAHEGNLSALLTAGLLGPAGIQSLNVETWVRIPKGSGLSKGESWLHSATGRMALDITLTLAPGAPPWGPGEVQLMGPSSEEPLPVRSIMLVGGATLLPGNTTRLLVEWDTPLEAEGIPYSLRVNERGGARAIIVDLSFPSAPRPQASAQEKKP